MSPSCDEHLLSLFVHSFLHLLNPDACRFSLTQLTSSHLAFPSLCFEERDSTPFLKPLLVWLFLTPSFGRDGSWFWWTSLKSVSCPSLPWFLQTLVSVFPWFLMMMISVLHPLYLPVYLFHNANRLWDLTVVMHEKGKSKRDEWVRFLDRSIVRCHKEIEKKT